MAKKLKVWLNNKLNKCLHFTVVMKFYRIFVTELVFSFFVVKYQNHFEFPKDGKRSLHLKILEIPGEKRVIKDPLEWKVLGGGGGGYKSKSLPWGRYGYFLEPHIVDLPIGNSRKYPYLYHRRLLGFPKGRGGSRLWNSKGMGGGGYLRLEIQRHGGIPQVGFLE